MKVGDRVEWEGLNEKRHGVIVVDESGDYIVRLPDGHAFALADLQFSQSARIIPQ